MKKHYVFNGPFEMKDEQGNKYTLTIKTDDSPENPRSWDNVATMVCWHSHYDLGDKHSFYDNDEFFDYVLRNICKKNYEDFEHLSTREKYQLACESDKIYIKELNAYEHGDITISTSNDYPYNDRWDAGCVGFVYITKETAFKELVDEYVLDENGEKIKIEHKHPNGQSTWSYKTQPLTDNTWKKRAEEVIDAEVKIYDCYLRDDVFGFELKEIIPVYGCGECSEEIDVNELLSFDQLSLDEKVHYCCPHCGADLGNDVDITSPLNIDIIEEEEKEIDSCWGFYGCEIETNGILDYLTNLEFVD